MIWLILSAAVMLLTAATHSFVGERRLITPVLAIDHPHTHHPLARQVLRGAWHLTSIFMVLSAVTILWPGVPRGIIMTVGVVWAAAGLIDLAYTRGAHIGWPMLTLAGALAVTGAAA